MVPDLKKNSKTVIFVFFFPKKELGANVHWRHSPKPEINLSEFINLLYDDNAIDNEGGNNWKNGQYRRYKKSKKK